MTCLQGIGDQNYLQLDFTPSLIIVLFKNHYWHIVLLALICVFVCVCVAYGQVRDMCERLCFRFPLVLCYILTNNLINI